MRLIRFLFLQVRCAYARQLSTECRPDQIRDACNIHDDGQARLIAMTVPDFSSRPGTAALAELLAQLEPKALVGLMDEASRLLAHRALDAVSREEATIAELRALIDGAKTGEERERVGK